MQGGHDPARPSDEGVAAMNDCAAIVVRAIKTLLNTEEFLQRVEDLLREEFADERKQAIADRSLPDA